MRKELKFLINKRKLCSIILVSTIMSLMFLSNVAAAVASISVFQDSGKVNYVIQVILSPSLNITKSVSPTTYSAVGQTITYTYTITNSGNVDLTGNITVADNKTGTFNITSNGLNVGKNVTGTANYTIHQSDIDAGSVTNSANATCSFNNALYTSKDITARINITQNPVLTVVKSAYPASYNAVGQTITYIYTITNSGNVDLTAPINVIDDKFGTVPIQSSDILRPGSSVQNTYSYRITPVDINAGSVTNLAYATGSLNNNSIISPQTVALVLYKQPTIDRDNNGGSDNGDYGSYFGSNNGGYGGCGDAVVPVPMMYGSAPYIYDSALYVYNSAPYVYNSAPYVYGSDSTGTTDSRTTGMPNSESYGYKVNVSSSECSTAKLSGSKANVYLSKHKQKKHFKHHKAKKSSSVK